MVQVQSVQHFLEQLFLFPFEFVPRKDRRRPGAPRALAHHIAIVPPRLVARFWSMTILLLWGIIIVTVHFLKRTTAKVNGSVAPSG